MYCLSRKMSVSASLLLAASVLGAAATLPPLTVHSPHTTQVQRYSFNEITSNLYTYFLGCGFFFTFSYYQYFGKRWTCSGVVSSPAGTVVRGGGKGSGAAWLARLFPHYPGRCRWLRCPSYNPTPAPHGGWPITLPGGSRGPWVPLHYFSCYLTVHKAGERNCMDRLACCYTKHGLPEDDWVTQASCPQVQMYSDGGGEGTTAWRSTGCDAYLLVAQVRHRPPPTGP